MSLQKWLLLLIATGLGGSTAAWAGKPVSGLAHDPPRFVDESANVVDLVRQGSDGYLVRVKTGVVGWSRGDRVRAEVSQNGKALSTVKCDVSDIGAGVGRVSCTDEKRLRATGTVVIDLIYEDDKDDKEYLVRSFPIQVVKWANDLYQLAPDDTLAVAYADQSDRGSAGGDSNGYIEFRFWAANTAQPATSWRCSVDGTQLPDDEGELTVLTTIDAPVMAKGKAETWSWSQYEFAPKFVPFGPKGKRASNLALEEHPGKWSCEIRAEGRAIRTLAFTVTPEGYVAPHPMQAAKGAYPTRKGIELVEIGIPKDAAFDKRIKPDAIKKSRGFGLPWPADPSVAAIVAKLPPGVESAVIKVPERKPGRRLSGLEHDPKRFIDEASTELMVHRSSDGYAGRVYAYMAGFTSTSDRVLLEWKAGGKLLAETACTVNNRGRFAAITCDTGDKPLTAKGPIEANLVLHDDQDGNLYVLRTYRVNVAKFPSTGDAVWQILADDTLATGYAWFDDSVGDEYSRHVGVMLWNTHTSEANDDLNLRCTVDGAKLPDIAADTRQPPGRMSVAAETHPKGKPDVTYRWAHWFLDTRVFWGKRETFKVEKNDRDVWLSDHPGKWDCILRAAGKPVRQLTFTATADGDVVPDPEQPGDYMPWVRPLDVRIPKDAKYDDRLRPDAMKKSRGFGLPWAKPPTKPMPAAGGLPDPK